MGAGDLLRELDSRVLPLLARAIARLAAGHIRLRLLIGVVLLCATAVLVTVVWTLDRTAPDDRRNADLLRVGVVEGQSVPGYVQSSRGELAALLRPPAPGATAVTEMYALVTLAAYVAPDRLAPVIGGASVSAVYARAPLTGVATQVLRIPARRLPDDVLTGMLDAARRRERELADYRRLGAGVDDRDARLRSAYENAAQVVTAEATAYRAACSCVFAVVARASPTELDRIAARPEVRAVDPAPEVRLLDTVEFSPPLPEQQTVVTEPSAEVVAPAPRSVTAGRNSRPTSAPARAQPQPSIPVPVTSASPGDPEATSEPSVGFSGLRTAVPSALARSARPRPPGRDGREHLGARTGVEPLATPPRHTAVPDASAAPQAAKSGGD